MIYCQLLSGADEYYPVPDFDGGIIDGRRGTKKSYLRPWRMAGPAPP